MDKKLAARAIVRQVVSVVSLGHSYRLARAGDEVALLVNIPEKLQMMSVREKWNEIRRNCLPQ